MINKENASFFWPLAVCCLIFWTAFYPGFMSVDSFDQFAVSKSLDFYDWHPPIMSWVWSVLGFIFPGPSGMLALHIALAWGAVYIWWGNYKGRTFSWLIFTIPFLPWVINLAGVLWKDVGMAFSLFLVSGLAFRTPTPWKIIFAFVIVFYAINLRYNAIFAAFPILIFLSYKWLKEPSGLKVFIVSCVVVYLCVFLGGVFNYGVLKAEKTNPSTFMMVDDLAYLSVKNNKSFLPGIGIDKIKECAALEIGQTKLVGRSFCLGTWSSKGLSPFSPELKTIWLTKIVENPIDYLRFRMAAFSYLLRKPTDPPYIAWFFRIGDNTLGLKMIPNGLTLIVERFVESSAIVAPFFFKPYWWLISSLSLLAMTLFFVKTKTVVAVRSLVMSSIFYILGYIPITPMADFRYIYWSVIATTISFVIILIDWPGFKTGISKRMVVVVSILVLICGLVIFNHGVFTSIDI